jgi:hypothetical protein
MFRVEIDLDGVCLGMFAGGQSTPPRFGPAFRSIGFQESPRHLHRYGYRRTVASMQDLQRGDPAGAASRRLRVMEAEAGLPAAVDDPWDGWTRGDRLHRLERELGLPDSAAQLGVQLLPEGLRSRIVMLEGGLLKGL